VWCLGIGGRRQHQRDVHELGFGDRHDVIPVADGTVNADGVPSYLSRKYLRDVAGVGVLEGIATDLDGNRLPQSPENTVHVGVAYTIDTAFGSFTPRVDYYRQGDMYAREYNTKGDYVSSWDQWTASLLYQSNDGRWEGRAWVRNLTDEDNITGKYLTSDTSGFYRAPLFFLLIERESVVEVAGHQPLGGIVCRVVVDRADRNQLGSIEPANVHHLGAAVGEPATGRDVHR
jgi:hypothetical protein